MKKFSYIFCIIFFIFSNNPSLATGVQTHPQSLPQTIQQSVPQRVPQSPKLKLPQITPVSPIQTPTQTPAKTVSEQPLPVPSNMIIEPIIPSPKPACLEPPKPMEANTDQVCQLYKKISLPEAIDYALSHNLDIKGNRLNVNIGKNDVKTADRLRNPYIQSFFNFGKAATDNPNTAGLIFPIDILKRGARKNLAKSNLELTKGSVGLAELNLRLDVRQAYVDLVAAKSMLKILSEQRRLLQELLDVAQKKYDAGAVPEMDVIQAKMTLNQILIQENSARTNVKVARYNFNKNLDTVCYDTLEDYLPEQTDFIFLLTPKPMEKMPEFDKLLDIEHQKRLDLKNAQKDIDIAQKNLVLVVRQRVPDIELGGGYMFVSPQLATSGNLAQGVFLAGNITNIPLLYQYSPEIKNAKIQVEQKQLAYKSLEHTAMMDLHSAYDEFNTAQCNLNYYNDILLSESNQFLKMAKRSYEVGKTNITNLIFIEQSYKTIVMGYTQALADYYDSWVDVLREVNDEGLKLNE